MSDMKPSDRESELLQRITDLNRALETECLRSARTEQALRLEVESLKEQLKQRLDAEYIQALERLGHNTEYARWRAGVKP